MDLLEVMMQGIGWDLLNPLIALPALALGWFARRRWQLCAGTLAIAAVQTMLALLTPLPAGAERLLWAEPLGLVAPGLLCLIGFQARRWVRSRDTTEPEDRLSRVVRTVIGATIGGGVGVALVLVVGLTVITLAGIHDRESGEAYLLAFVLAPMGLLSGLVGGAILARPRSAAGVPTVPAGLHPRPEPKRAHGISQSR